MRPLRLLYLCMHEMSAWYWRRGAFVLEAEFPLTEAGFQQFAQYLAQNPKSTFSLLANVADEGFHIDAIPYLSGADRKTVIRRKLAQTFFNAPFSAAFSLGYEKNRRKDERLLLANLADPAFFQPWIDVIRTMDAALSGLYSLPLIAPELFRLLRLPPAPCLLLTIQDQSVRQGFIDRGELNFSRLTPLKNGDIAGVAQAFSLEAAKLQQYLVSRRLIGHGQTITAYILAHPDAFDLIQKTCTDTPVLRFSFLDITECARRAGLSTLPQDTRAEMLFLHLLAAHPPSIQFASDELRHGFWIAQMRAWFRYAGTAALIACLAFSGKYELDARRIAQDTGMFNAEASEARQRYGEIVRTFPFVPTDNETLRKVIERYQIEEQRSTTPMVFYQKISRALEAESAIDIHRLDWRIGEASAESGELTLLPEDSESVDMYGTLRHEERATTRQSLATFTRFIDILRFSGLRTEVLRQPLDIASGSSLRSDDTAQKDEKLHDFSLRLTFKPGNAPSAFPQEAAQRIAP